MQILSALILSLILASPSAFARAGNDQGNGGDLYSAEFVELGQRVADLLRNNATQDLDITKLQEMVDHAKVESTDLALSLNGIPKDAINYPADKRIVFNRARWKAMDAGEKPALVLHEYLGLLGMEDASYRFSKRVLGAFKYDVSYSVDCEMSGGAGNLNIGIDESAGMDTILMSLNWAKAKFEMGDVMRPVGEFSNMIRDGSFSLAFDDKFLVSLRSGPAPKQMQGSFAAHGKVYSLTCVLKQIDMSKFGS